jgi:hypothetical protein
MLLRIGAKFVPREGHVLACGVPFTPELIQRVDEISAGHDAVVTVGGFTCISSPTRDRIKSELSAGSRARRSMCGACDAHAPIALRWSPWMTLRLIAPWRSTVTKRAPSPAASAQSGLSTPHLAAHRTPMSEISPRPQRRRTQLCGEAALTLGAATARAFLVHLTLTRRQTRSPGGSPACLATRAETS